MPLVVRDGVAARKEISIGKWQQIICRSIEGGALGLLICLRFRGGRNCMVFRSSTDTPAPSSALR